MEDAAASHVKASLPDLANIGDPAEATSATSVASAAWTTKEVMEEVAASHEKAFQPNKKPRWGNGASEYNFCSTTGVVKVNPRLSTGATERAIR